jgi:23S rRNA pseudouridine1911/1915/1917 synthase
MAVRPPGAGRAAETRYRVRARFTAPAPMSLLDVVLGTGRTHQIRVHLAHLGFPVVGDRTYRRGGVLAPDLASRVRALEGQALHAGVLGFTHPETGQRLSFQAPLPPAFSALLEWLEGFPRVLG